MNKLTEDTIDTVVNRLLETTSGDVGQFPELMKPLLYRVYTESLVSLFADTQQLTSPLGRVYTLFSSYGGNDTDDLSYNNSSVLTVVDGSTILIDSTVTTTTGTGTIVYKEGNNLLVKIVTGYFAPQQTMGATTITDVISNRSYTKKVFKNYSGPYTTSDGESVSPLNIDYELTSTEIDVKTRKIKSKITQEVLHDIKTMYGEDMSKNIIANEFSAEMIQSIDMEVIDYLRTIATPTSDLILSNSYGTQNDIAAISNDVYSNIYKLTVDLMKGTKRRKNFFVLADAATIGLMMTSPLHMKPEKSTNIYYMGKIGGTYTLLLDPYATDHYVLVGYRNENKEVFGDSGLIFAPYINTITSTVEPETGKALFFNMFRYGYTQHPQDITGAASSIFFKTFNVNLDNLKNYTNLA